MMTGEYATISAAIGTVLVACAVLFCQLESAIKKRRLAIAAIRQEEKAAMIRRLRTYVIP